MTIANVTAGALIDPAWGNSVADAINEGFLSDWTPTYTNVAAFSGVVAKYRQVGDVVWAHFTGGFSATPTGQYRISLPVAPISPWSGVGVARIQQGGSPFNRYDGVSEINTAVFGNNVIFASTGNNGWSATAPAAAASGWSLFWEISYQVAS